MSVEVGIGNETPKRSMGPSLPSDFTDVQPRSYDPEFISDISNKMQVPHRIAVGEDEMMNSDGQEFDYDDHSTSRPMNVPDRIILTGANEHAAMRSRLQQFQFDSAPSAPDMSYVNLITPPRTLTLGEGFPTVEDHVTEEERTDTQALQLQHTQMNGSAVPVPFTPGISPNESLLLNEEAEGTLLRTQLAKLTRRLTVMEQENQKRSQREILLYPMVFGYFLFKVFGWFFRSGR